MPTAPRQHRPHNQTLQQQRQDYDRWRGSAADRGYTWRWSQYAERLCREMVFCELCITIGIETPVVRGDRRYQSTVDHTIPVHGESDPLFWEPANHRCLCRACNQWKSMTFDGWFGRPRREATDRTLRGVEVRWREVVGEYGKAQGV